MMLMPTRVHLHLIHHNEHADGILLDVLIQRNSNDLTARTADLVVCQECGETVQARSVFREITVRVTRSPNHMKETVANLSLWIKARQWIRQAFARS